MNHNFVSKRDDRSAILNALQLVDDIDTFFTRLTTQDRELVRSRCDVDVADESVRNVLQRNAFRVGHMTDDLQHILETHNIAWECKHKDWVQFLEKGSTTLTSPVSLKPQLDSILESFSNIEKDQYVSSASDYSDSRTDSESSASDSEHTTEDSTQSDSETEEM